MQTPITTQKIGLNQWTPSDPLNTPQFNEDNLRIDNAFEELNNKIPTTNVPLDLLRGGLGANTAADGRDNLGLKSGATREIQTGSVSVTTTAGATVTVPIAFPLAFSGAPKVTPVIQTGSPHLRNATPTGISSTGCTFNVHDDATTGGTYTIGWTAIY